MGLGFAGVFLGSKSERTAAKEGASSSGSQRQDSNGNDRVGRSRLRMAYK